MSESKQKKHTGLLIFFICLLIFGCWLYFATGVFVVQPLGNLPDGITIWYFRSEFPNMPFISSPDGLLLKDNGSVSLLGRGVMLSTVFGGIESKIIARLPYSKSLYLISTGGKEFEN